MQFLLLLYTIILKHNGLLLTLLCMYEAPKHHNTLALCFGYNTFSTSCAVMCLRHITNGEL